MPKDILYMRVEPTKEKPDVLAYIFISEGEPDEDVGALCDKFEKEHIAHHVFPGQALLVDLRGKEPRFERGPLGHVLPEHRRARPTETLPTSTQTGTKRPE